MPGRDTRVEHRDANPRSAVAVRLLHGARTHRDGDAVHLATRRAVVDDPLDRGIVGNLLEPPVGELGNLAVDQAKTAAKLATDQLDVRVHAQARLQDHDDL